MKRRDTAWFIAKLAVSASLLAFIAQGIDPGALGSRLAGLHYAPAVLAVVVLLLQFGVASCRWHSIMQCLGAAPPLTRLWRHCMVAQCFGQALPSAVGGDVIRVWLVRRDGVGLRAGLVSVVLDRLLGLAALVVVVIVAMLSPSGVTQDLRARFVLSVIAVAALGGLAAALLVARLPANWFAHRRVLRLAHDLARGLHAVFTDARAAFAVGGSALLVHLLSIAGIWLLARSLDVEVGVLTLATIVPVALLAASIPVSIGGWGVREGVLVKLLATQGVAADSALALSVLFGLALALASLPGGLLWLSGRTRLAQAAEAVQSDYQTL